jgi:beta-glucosidase-like glycosyl hydrolase
MSQNLFSFVVSIVLLCLISGIKIERQENGLLRNKVRPEAKWTGSQTAQEIVASLTLEEKIGQMVQIDISTFMIEGTDEVDYDKLAQWVNDYKIGSVLNSPFSTSTYNGVTGWTATQWRDLIIHLQEITQTTEAKIPIIYGIDSIHGATFVQGAALFPQAIAMAATFDVNKAYSSAQVSSRDTRAAGIQWLFAPVLGLGLHPLWARFPETFGEDPYLAAQMGKAVIDGMQAYDATSSASTSASASADIQHKTTTTTTAAAAPAPAAGVRVSVGDDDSTTGIPARAAACMKHFIAYSFPANGHDRSPVLLPDRMVRQLYMPSFQAAIDTGVLSAMESYQEVGGEPMVSSKAYLTNLLRKEMKFTGMMVTDYKEIENLHGFHMVSATEEDAALLSMQGETECPPFPFYAASRVVCCFHHLYIYVYICLFILICFILCSLLLLMLLFLLLMCWHYCVTDTTVDMSMVPTDSSFSTYLLDLVNTGALNVSRIDESATRVIQLKLDLGMFDAENQLFSAHDTMIDQVGQQSDWDLSLDASRAAMTLLKNDNGVLPILNPAANVFVTGPTADSLASITGGWSVHWQGPQQDSEVPMGISILAG